MQERDLWSQGGFVIYKAGKELDAPYRGLGPFPEGPLFARLRARSVEIDYALGELDAARITFLDPERVFAGYIAEIARDPTYRAEKWTVGVGYHFSPPSAWAWFTGIPILEDCRFPSDGPPEVIIHLLDPSVVLMRTNSSAYGVKSRHWLYPPEEPPSLRKALQAMAEFYGAELVLGRVEKVITLFDDHMAYYMDDPLRYLVEKHTGGPTWDIPNWLMPATPLSGFEEASYQLHRTLLRTRNLADLTDWQYLQILKTSLQELVNKYAPEDTLGISDTYWSKVRFAGNEIVTIISEGKLWFATLKDYMREKLSFISVFSYQRDDCSLLEFTPEMTAAAAGTQAISIISSFFSSRTGKNEIVEVKIPETQVLAGRDDPEMRVKVPPADPEEGDPGHLDANKGIRLILAPHTKDWGTAPLEQVLGELATNLRARATVLGSPWLRAGMLVGTRGLGPGPENRPNPNEPQRLNTYDRVWIAQRVVHRVDETGFYFTELELMGASTDNSSQLIKGGTDAASILKAWADLLTQKKE